MASPNLGSVWEDDDGYHDAADPQDTQDEDILVETNDQPDIGGEIDQDDPFSVPSSYPPVPKSSSSRRILRLKDFAGIYDPPPGGTPLPLGTPDKMTIVDISGVHRVHVQFCQCHGIGDSHAREAQLLEANLFPTSFTTFKSAFTFRVLDGFRAANLDCKTSAYHYFQMLRRLTSPAFPSAVPVWPT